MASIKLYHGRSSKEVMNDLLRKLKFEFRQKPIKEIEVDSLAKLKEYIGKI